MVPDQETMNERMTGGYTQVLQHGRTVGVRAASTSHNTSHNITTTTTTQHTQHFQRRRYGPVYHSPLSVSHPFLASKYYLERVCDADEPSGDREDDAAPGAHSAVAPGGRRRVQRGRDRRDRARGRRGRRGDREGTRVSGGGRAGGDARARRGGRRSRAGGRGSGRGSGAASGTSKIKGYGALPVDAKDLRGKYRGAHARRRGACRRVALRARVRGLRVGGAGRRGAVGATRGRGRAGVARRGRSMRRRGRVRGGGGGGGGARCINIPPSASSARAREEGIGEEIKRKERRTASIGTAERGLERLGGLEILRGAVRLEALEHVLLELGARAEAADAPSVQRLIPKQDAARSIRATGKGGRIHETYEEQPLDCWDEERQLVMHGSRFWAATPPIAAARTKEAKANFIVLAGRKGTRGRGERGERKNEWTSASKRSGVEGNAQEPSFIPGCGWQMFDRDAWTGTDGEEKDDQARSGRFSGGRSAHLPAAPLHHMDKGRP